MEISIEVNSAQAYRLMQKIAFKDYYAFSEFIDNSIQSYLDNKDKINELGQKSLEVKLSIDKQNNTLLIEDNAGGIAEDKFLDALKLGVPKDSETSLHEFGVGMKIAALWLGDSFTIETSALGENWKTTVRFDITEIQEKDLSKLNDDQIKREKADVDDHYTILSINLKRTIHRNRYKGIVFHITDVYRSFIENKDLTLTFQNEECKSQDSEILNTPYWDDKFSPYNFSKDSPSILWEKEIDFEMPAPIHYAKGKVFILETGSNNKSGLVIYRRNRAILGAGLPDPGDQKDRYRPTEIFQNHSANKFKRLQGYIHFGDSTKVTNNKLINWFDNNGNSLEDIFIDKLKKELKGDRNSFKKAIDNNEVDKFQSYLPILHHAEQFRVTLHKKNSKKKNFENAERAVEDTASDIKNNTPNTSRDIMSQKILNNQMELNDKPTSLDPLEPIISEKDININMFDKDWKITIRGNDDRNPKNWYKYVEDVIKNEIGVSLAMNHPFTLNMQDSEGKVLETMIRFSAALALAEVITKNYSKNKEVTDSVFRMIFNEILLKDLSKQKLI